LAIIGLPIAAYPPSVINKEDFNAPNLNIDIGVHTGTLLFRSAQRVHIRRGHEENGPGY
jgi:hypothetical protein